MTPVRRNEQIPQGIIVLLKYSLIMPSNHETRVNWYKKTRTTKYVIPNLMNDFQRGV